MLTDRQKALMTVILSGAARGSWFDIDELIEELGKAGHAVATKQSIQFSLRYLANKGLLAPGYETRRGRKRMIPTPLPPAMKLGL